MRPLRLDTAPAHLGLFRTQGSLAPWRAALLAALGLVPVSSCGKASDPGAGDSGPEAASGGAGGQAGTGAIAGAGGQVLAQGGAGAGGAGSRSFPPVCTSQTDENGYVSCLGGWFHRPERSDCPSQLPRATSLPLADGGVCTDANCAERPNGYCEEPLGGGGGTSCNYGCVRDADCSPGQICFCGDPVGRCLPATCTTDADCPGSLCAATYDNSGCGAFGPKSFACAQAEDQCLATSDCGGRRCEIVAPYEGGPATATRRCVLAASCGRPYLIQGTARQAEPALRSDWSAPGASPDLTALDSAARSALAAHWTQIGLLEHASVAAFARFALELLAAGAPAELLSRAQRALGDELEHARGAFALAGAYAGEPIGPGPLGAQGALSDASLEASVVAAIYEACVGETLAAMEAREALAGARDPAARALLTKIAEDESAHAELGWRFLQWALARAGAPLRARAQSELQRAVREALLQTEDSLAGAPPAAALAPQLEEHGLCPSARRAAARRAALLEVVLPLTEALCAEPPRSERQCPIAIQLNSTDQSLVFHQVRS